MAGLPLEGWQADGIDLMLSHDERLMWLAREYAEWVGRQEGKTTGIGIPRALAGLLLLGERLIMWSAHEVKTALEAFLQMRQALEQLGEEAGPNLIALNDGELMVKVVNNNGYEGFTLSTGQRMRFVARSKNSGRGFSGDCNIIDEAFAYTRQQQSALEPTQAARPNPQTIYLSSPPLRGDTAEGEVMFALAERAVKADVKLGYRDWGLGQTLDDLRQMKPNERAAFLDDRDNWSAALPALGRGRVTEESVAHLRRTMDEFDFAREVLGCWPVQVRRDGGWSVISRKSWDARSGAEGRPDESVSFCLDASWPDAAFGAIGVAGRLGDELVVQVLEHRPGTAWMVRRAVELRDRWPGAVFVLDKKGPAGHLLRDLADADIDVLTPSVEEVARAFGELVAAVSGDEPTLRHFDQPELNAAVKAAGTRPLGDARTWARRGEVDISPLTAVTGALHGVHEGSAEPWVLR
ncbi:hypothetical protein [Pseudonocardia sp.]|uniref:hypothetical protein n=1 Tax=Pseudonocardia sp. TaxID=60912 RepID=UPI003D0D6807